jgi:hypothetical protein
LNSGENLGTATALGGEALVECNLGILGTLHCVYGGPKVEGFSLEGALHQAGTGHGMFTTKELTVPIVEKISGACPSESKFTALYEPLVHLWITT